ncbi:hypothetical protein WNY98_17310 [Pseudoalteromonas sp. AS71]|uniref:hypothetical protein n=1 Tax=Pseudoalteromonas sp. AS71 TaxID=3135777 RepID=UPI00316CE2F4
MSNHLIALLGSAALLTLSISVHSQEETSKALYSIDTGYTISKVRTATSATDDFILASGYDGNLLGVSFGGQVLWNNPLSGYMNHDIWAADITQDGVDEVLAANADGHVYCLSSKGELLWSFKPNDVPMYSVTVVHKDGKPYVVAGSYDKSVYYLDHKGKLVKELKSSNYSEIRAWNKKSADHEPGTRFAPNNRHIANILRPIPQENGDDILAMHATINSMQSPGTLFLFAPLQQKPLKTVELKKSKTAMGDMRVVDANGDGHQDLIFGSSKMKGQNYSIYDGKTGELSTVPLGKVDKIFDEFGYRVTQTEVISNEGKLSLFVLYGNSAAIIPVGAKKPKGEIITSKYAFNDLWKDPKTGKIILASAQSGGSAIHVVDTTQSGWTEKFVLLDPPGKVSEMLANTAKTKADLTQFKARKEERDPRPVYLMSDSSKTSPKVIEYIHKNYTSPVFLDYGSLGTEKWDRSVIENEFYRNKRDKRQKYNLSQEQILKKAEKLYKGNKGAAFWGGHGNDPYYRSLDTHIKTLKVADGRKTVMIFPEVAHYERNLVATIDAFIYPLAEVAQKSNANVFLRNKHTFWQSHIYKEGWSRLLSGEFADVFVPAMEETTDKSMDLSIAARSGLWASGVVNQWGTRFSRDNTSFDRLRQHSHQMVPNHALRQFVYHISNGSTYVNNFIVDQDYIKLMWDLVGQGVLYVPQPNEILSYSPVHLSMVNPDDHYVDEGNNVKWLNMFDSKVEAENPMVFSRLNGSWPGSPVTEWDFSRYAAGVNDRHLNFLPEYPNGLVLITPPQEGPLADKTAPRGALKDRLHPIYKDILEEFYTNGRDYLSADGKTKYRADEYYQLVKKSIEEKSKLLPVTVSGDVAWVVAQTSPKNLRLTLIDGGYINPKSGTASVTFNTINPVSVRDILDGSEYKVKSGKTTIQVPTGLFRFIDIELAKPL